MWDSGECLRQSTRVLTGPGGNSEVFCQNRPNVLTGRSVHGAEGWCLTDLISMNRWIMPRDISAQLTGR
ncbi:unnamed protein product [Prunus armeniaca]